MKLAWQRGFRKLIIESDSAAIITIIQKGNHEVHAIKLLKLIFEWQQRDWDLKFCHTYREGNICADWLANWSLDFGARAWCALA